MSGVGRTTIMFHCRTTVYTQLLALFHLALAKQQCNTYPNYKTKAFTYIVCTGTSVTNLESSRQFCQENYESSDVITFPSKDEFDFITEVMNSSLSQTHSKFKYFPGIFQRGDEASRYNPETGEYFWITDPENRLTNESTSYWKPFDFILSRFPDQSLWIRQRATFLLDINGEYYPGQALFSLTSETDVDGGVVCTKKGVPEIVTASATLPNVGNGGEPSENCTTYPNYNTKAFTYIVCTGTSVTNLESSRQFCQENHESSDIVTFPSKAEFEYLTTILMGKVRDKNFRYVPGFVQKALKDPPDRYQPQTGKYYWVTSPNSIITPNSTTYWKPLDHVISNFNNQSLTVKHHANFVLDIYGQWYFGQYIGHSRSDETINGVICLQEGVATKEEEPNGISALQTRIIIGALVTFILLAILLAVIGYMNIRDSQVQKELTIFKQYLQLNPRIVPLGLPPSSARTPAMSHSPRLT